MALVIVNPRPRSKAPKAPTPAHRAKKKGTVMAKSRKRRSPAQQAATQRMLAAAPHRRRRNPAPRRKAVTRRRVRRNPTPISRRIYRRRRNPSNTTLGTIKDLFSTEGVMKIGAVVGTPTLATLVQEAVAPNATGFYASGIQALVGLVAAWGVGKFNKEIGETIGLVAIGTAIAQSIQTYTTGAASTLSGGGMEPGFLGSYTAKPRMAMNGYTAAPQQSSLGGYSGNHEPGMRFM